MDFVRLIRVSKASGIGLYCKTQGRQTTVISHLKHEVPVPSLRSKITVFRYCLWKHRSPSSLDRFSKLLVFIWIMIQSFEFAEVDLRKSTSDLSKCETTIREKHEFVDVCNLVVLRAHWTDFQKKTSLVFESWPKVSNLLTWIFDNPRQNFRIRNVRQPFVKIFVVLFSELIGSMCEPLIYGLLFVFHYELTRHRGFSECSPVTWFPKIIIRL